MTYILPKELFDKLVESKYISEILYSLTNTYNNCKVAIDDKERILGIYQTIKCHVYDILCWIKIMTDQNKFEQVTIDENTSDDDIVFLETAIKTKGSKRLIVYSLQNTKYEINDNNEIIYKSCIINVINKETASNEINANSCYTNINYGQQAIDGNINESNNKTKL